MIIYDGSELNSHDWKRTILAPMGKVDHDAFQAELDKLVGVEPDGTKRLRLVWMPTFMRWDRYIGRWIPFRCVKAKREVVPGEDTKVVGVEFDYHGIPRYAVVGLVPEESRQSALERSSVGFDGDGAFFSEDRTEHEYRLVMPIWEHDPRLLPVSQANACCAEMSSRSGKKCWGKYRPPDQADIIFLTEQMAMLSPMLESKPFERSTDRDRWRIAKMMMDIRQARLKKEDEEDSYIVQTDLMSTFNNRVYSLPN